MLKILTNVITDASQIISKICDILNANLEIKKLRLEQTQTQIKACEVKTSTKNDKNFIERNETTNRLIRVFKKSERNVPHTSVWTKLYEIKMAKEKKNYQIFVKDLT